MNEQRDLTPIISEMPEEMQGQARRFVETDQMIHAADEKIKQLGSKNWMPTKFEQYTLPGEKSGYQEKLLTLPSKGPISFEDWVKKETDAGSGYDLSDPVEAAKARRGYDRVVAYGGATPNDFKSSHFPEDPNILAHVRYDDRPALDGKKTLFLEEVQSDWHQKKRRASKKATTTRIVVQPWKIRFPI
jgi:hypothetical protein